MAQIFEVIDHVNSDTDIVSVKSDTDILDKGYLCSLGTLAYWDVYNVTEPTGATSAATPTEADLVMILGGDPYEDANGQRTGGVRDPRDITYAAGRIVAASRIPLGCRIKIDEDSIDDSSVAIAVGKYLIPKDGGYDMVTSATIPSGVGFVLKIDKEDSFPVGGEYVDAVIARRVV